MKMITTRLMAAGVVASLMVPAVVRAQGGPGGGGPGGAMRNSAKMRLSGLVRGIGELEKGSAALTRPQAARVVTLITPWQNKPHMTENDAKALYMQVNSTLTTKQKNELDKLAALRRRRGEGGGRGGAGSGGAGGGGFDPARMQQMRQQMQKLQGFFKTYNPLYPPGNYRELKEMPAPMQESFTRRYHNMQVMLASLAHKAHGK